MFAADVATSVTDGVVEALPDMAELLFGTVVGHVVFNGLFCTVFTGVVAKFDGLAWPDFFVAVDAVREDAEVCFGEAVAGLDKPVAGADVIAAGADVGWSAVASGESFAAVVLVSVTGFTVVVTAGVALAVFDSMVVVVEIVEAGTDVGIALSAMVGGAAGGAVATVVATVVVLAESGPVVFTVVEA